MDQDTFTKPVTIPKNHNVIITKIVSNVEYIENNNIARYKTCLVARDFIQVHGVDYEETFA